MSDRTKEANTAWYESLLTNRRLGWLLLAPLALLIAATALQYHRIEAKERAGEGPAGSMLIADETVSSKRVLNDYDDFYVVGRLHREGEILAAYNNDYLLAAQQRFTGAQTFMPWAYPPQLTSLVPLLPMIGMGWGFMLFMGTTLVLYFAVLNRFGPRYTGAALLAVYPALLLNARLGQNGFLTASLIGLFFLAFRARRDSAGIPLGLMAIKPHLGIAIGLLALLEKRWRTLALGVAVALATCLAATLVLGLEAWPAFVGGLADAGGFLREGRFPLYRMSSVYAGVRSFDLSADVAFAAHAIAAIVAIALLLFAYVRRWPTNRLLALTAVITVFISPYNYDYDFACLAIAVSLVLPEMFARIRLVELVVFYVLCWIGSGSGLAQHFHAVLLAGTTEHPHGSSLNWSFQAVGVIAASVLAARVLCRPVYADRTAEQGKLIGSLT